MGGSYLRVGCVVFHLSIPESQYFSISQDEAMAPQAGPAAGCIAVGDMDRSQNLEDRAGRKPLLISLSEPPSKTGQEGRRGGKAESEAAPLGRALL